MAVRGRIAAVVPAVLLVVGPALAGVPIAEAVRMACPTPGTTGPAGGSGGCPGVHRADHRTCVTARVRLCLLHDLPPTDVGADPDRDCPDTGSDPAIRVRTPATNASVCVSVDPDARLPGIGVDPPGPTDAGPTFTSPCATGAGRTVVVAGLGGTVCLQVDAGTGGETFDVDLSPCPGGTDPRVDVAGVFVRVCLIVEPRTGTDGLPDPSAGDVDLPRPDQHVPELGFGPCGRGVGVQGEALDAVGTVCVRVDRPSAPSTGDCGNRTGATVGFGEPAAGACAG